MNQAIIRSLHALGVSILRYGLVFLLLMWGGAKFTQFEAELIRPLVANSPLVGWLYQIVGLRGTSAIFGTFEVIAALLIASRKWLPRPSGYASLATVPMFLTTLSFLLTTPDVFEPSSPWAGFLIKDIMLLGAAVFTAAEALEQKG